MKGAKKNAIVLLLNLKAIAGLHMHRIAELLGDHETPGFVDFCRGIHLCHFTIENGISRRWNVAQAGFFSFESP
jgi:hypothetical protein